MADKKEQQNHQPPDPRAAEAQLYARLEQAKGLICNLINRVTREAGLPAVLVCSLVHEVATETMLSFERQAHRQTRAELAMARAELEKLKNVEAEKTEAAKTEAVAKKENEKGKRNGEA